MFKKADKKQVEQSVTLEYVRKFLVLLKDQDFQFIEVKKTYMLKLLMI